jgi:CDP-diacylglycerol--glycerol-3-phosphate 3-phosphatidyltransferase
MKFFTPPNQLTFLRILLTPVFLVFLLSSNVALLQWSIVVFILAALTDWYDGWLARRWGYVTTWGAFFDPFADKVVTSAALIAYAYLGLISAWMVWIIVIRDALITLLRSYGEYKGKSIDTPKLAKTKTFAQFVIIYYLLILYVAQNTPYIEQNYGELIHALLDATLVYSMMIAVTALTLWTGIVHIYDNWKTIKELYDSSNKAAPAE